MTAALKFDPTPLRNAMVLRQLTIEQMVVLTGCPRGTIGTVLAGRCNKSTAIVPLCKALGVKIEDCYHPIEAPVSR